MERWLTSFLHARGAAIVASLLVVCATYVAWLRGVETLRQVGDWQMWCACGAYVLMAGAALQINRSFNVLRSLTSLTATVFLVMMASLPGICGRLYDGTLLLALVLAATALLFGAYDRQWSQRSVFLVFLMFGAAGMWRLQFTFYLPVLLLGVAQMRLASGRSLVAAAMGLVTPAWLLLGFGLIPWDNGAYFVALWQRVDLLSLPVAELRQLLVVGFTVLIGLVFTVINLVKILSYNARVRSFNGMLTLLFFYTALLAALDMRQLLLYVPLLDCMTAYQVAHFFTYRRHHRSYIAILLLILVYAAAYAWCLIE